MNIIIPLGGLGERFKKEGYNEPKPLIKMLGKEMILYVIDTLKLDQNDTIHIIYNPDLDKHGFCDILMRTRLRINFIKLHKQTEGAVESILIGLNTFNDVDLNKKCMLLDCDTFYVKDITSIYRYQNENAVFAFIDNQDKPIFSYINYDKNSFITEIKEKQKISKYANTGCYCFKDGNILKQYCQKVMSENIRQKGEYYTSCVIDLMIKDGHKFHANIISDEDFHCVGTPLQLKLYCINNIKGGKKLRICFDLDGTLVTDPQIQGDYKTVKPINKNIEFLKYLKSIGHEIIIHTARRMRTHNGNIGKLMKDIGKITLDSLDEFGIPYDEIYFGKPYADYYVDDRAINVYNDLEKEFGVYLNKVDERNFNHITTTNMEVIIKKGQMDKLMGEIHWYKNIPKNVMDLFPTFIREEYNGYMIEKINSITLSHLYLKEALTHDMLLNLLKCIDRIHHSLDIVDDTVNIYSNYSQKIKERYETYDYTKFNNSNKVYQDLMIFFDNYEKNNEGMKGVIHGDPVFSNILVTKDITFKFIDMRGKLGVINTIFGDILYDYAKVYQSLIGYDEILLDKSVSMSYKNILLNTFCEYIKTTFDDGTIDKIKMICNSLLFTLIPLHDNEKCFQYYNLINHP